MSSFAATAAFTARCARLTASPEEPSWTCGVLPADSSAVHVLESTVPVRGQPLGGLELLHHRRVRLVQDARRIALAGAETVGAQHTSSRLDRLAGGRGRQVRVRGESIFVPVHPLRPPARSAAGAVPRETALPWFSIGVAFTPGKRM
nr:hypothetical protein [Allokutzneria albata]